MTSRELVLKTLKFENCHGRVPNQLWCLPWAKERYPDMVQRIEKEYPDDIVTVPVRFTEQNPITKGDLFSSGEYVDEWGCQFTSIQSGIVGEVKAPIVAPEDEEWADVSRIHVPTEWLSFDVSEVNAFCENTECFTLSAACPRPFEQLQFIRGSERLYIDLFEPSEGFYDFVEKMHAFYCALVKKWCETKVDAIQFMDDWGAQQSLLIHPDQWRKIFKPLYKDYVDLAHKHGKKAFMHSDGHILSIIPDLIEIGVDALNSQIFCMGVENLAPFKGEICFWGEIDRQYLLPYGTTEEIDKAVDAVANTLWENGGCIAQCEFGPGAKPENAYEVFKAWGRRREEI